MQFKSIALLAGILLAAPHATSIELVTKESVAKQKKLTQVIKLSNGIPVIYRQVAGSDIAYLKVQFDMGNKDLKHADKPIFSWLTSVMPKASKNFPKQKMFKTIEKYSIIAGCSDGVEVTSCDLSTVNDFWNQSLDLFADFVLNPTLDPKDAQNSKDGLVASLQSSLSDPGSNINNVVNTVFYGKSHPYRGSTEDKLENIKRMTVDDLQKAHRYLMNSSHMTLVIATSLPPERVLGELNAKFGKVGKSKKRLVKVPKPKFRKNGAFALESKDLPTAYLRLKVNAPAATDKDAIATQLMFDIISENMFDEIRSKRSLSYSPYATSLMMSVGLGVFDITSPKPKEAIEALRDIINDFKAKKMTKEELAEHKNIYATRYFARQETHGALVGTLARYYKYFKSTDAMYEMPLQLAEVTPDDVAKAADRYLKNMRLGVIYDKDKFKKEWLKILP